MIIKIIQNIIKKEKNGYYYSICNQNKFNQDDFRITMNNKKQQKNKKNKKRW